jgi:assimilatory nitrate reductase catalytic subunit
VLIRHDGTDIHDVAGDPEHPANLGRLCSKGATLHLSARPEGRLLHPALRSARGADPRALGWSEALDHAAQRFAEVIRRDGPDAVGFYISGQLLTEDYYVFNKLAKGLIGTNNVDTNSRLCMSSAVAAYKQTLGADAPPCSYEDFDHADCLLIAGSNMAYAHPVAYRRIEAARAARPAMRLIVVDPRRTDTASGADLHLALLPGTDIWLYNAMLHVLLWDGYVDEAFVRDHTEGFEALKAHVREVTPGVAAGICGLEAEDIVRAAHWWGESPAAMSLWCQGLNQSHHGTHNGTALIALSLATGKIGRPGSGPFSLTGQPNAMGGREVGGMANLLSGHRDLANPAHRAEVAALWGIPQVPERPGYTAVELFEAARLGKIKALWIACTNPAQSMPQQALIRDALAACPFVVVQESYADTETAAFADLLLPATTWGEKDGTVTNSERCISRVLPAIRAPGEARHDWQIATDFARALGVALGSAALAERLFDYADSASVFAEHALTTAGRDLDITGLSHARLESAGPVQWPCPSGSSDGTQRLYIDHRFATANGRARFVVPVRSLTAEPTNSRYPLRLTTGRLRDQWHGMSRTGKVAQLHNHVDEARIELHPEDLEWRGLRAGELVQIRSRRGAIVLRAAASDALKRGQAFVAMHWGRQRLNSAGINELTLNATDPYSKQPELKAAAIQIERADLPHEALLLRTDLRAEDAQHRLLELQATLAPLLGAFGYATVFLAGREAPSLVLRIAHDEPIPDTTLMHLDALFGLDHADCLSFSDRRRGISKRARIESDRLLALRLCGETAAREWLQDLMVGRHSVQTLRRWLMAPLITPPVATPARGRVVCSCMDVPEPAIRASIATGANLAQLQETLACGTKCGSCLPELRRMLADAAAPQLSPAA